MPGQQPSDIQGSDPCGRPFRRANDRDEVDQLKAEVHCATVLERLPPTWRLDQGESTRRARKYRRGAGEIIIVNHDGRGWWNPGHAQAKGDVFNLVQHLDPGLSFGEVRRLLRTLAGMVLAFPEHLRNRPRRRPSIPVDAQWCRRPTLATNSATWRYLTLARGLPPRILHHAAWHGVIREGPEGSAWFAHRHHDHRLSGIEMRGPKWRGFSADGEKSLFRLPGSNGMPTRLAVVEAPIDALSLAALEGPWPRTLYLATAGGMGPATLEALKALLSELADRPHSRLVAATDADVTGDRYAAQLAELAGAAGVQPERLRPPRGVKDWNDLLRTAQTRRRGEAPLDADAPP
jgi:hypothetical protein